MKRLISLLLVFIIIFTMFGCAKKETKSLTEYNNSNPKDMSFISVKDGYLVNEDGEEIVLKGVNLGNWLLWETWMGFVPEYTDDWAYFDTLEVLLERFGEEKTNEIIRTFEDNFITEEDIAQIEKFVGAAEPISKMLEKGMTLQQIAETVTGDDNLMVMLKEINPKYECNCNKEKFLKGLVGLKKEDIEELFNNRETIETVCDFCNKKYEFKAEEVLNQ